MTAFTIGGDQAVLPEKGKRGRPPISLERMLRIYTFFNSGTGLSDEGLEDALYDSVATRAFGCH